MNDKSVRPHNNRMRGESLHCMMDNLYAPCLHGSRMGSSPLARWQIRAEVLLPPRSLRFYFIEFHIFARHISL